MEKLATTVSEPHAKREYKDTVFRMLFSDKEKLLSLYNAMNDRHYENAEDLKNCYLEERNLHGNEKRSCVYGRYPDLPL